MSVAAETTDPSLPPVGREPLPSFARAPIVRRSAVTNGRRPFVDGDPHSKWTRRYLDLIANHVADLGGRDVLSEAQVSLVKRASTLEAELEQMEGKLSKGENVDLDAYGRATNTLRRTLETLGIQRLAREVSPSLAAFLRHQAPEPHSAPLAGSAGFEVVIDAGEEEAAPALPQGSGDISSIDENDGAVAPAALIGGADDGLCMARVAAEPPKPDDQGQAAAGLRGVAAQ